MDKKINVLIKEDNSIFVETDNYKGEACVKAVKDLFEQFFQIDDLNLTSDYYDDEATINTTEDIKI